MIRKSVIFVLTVFIIFSLNGCSKEQKETESTSEYTEKQEIESETSEINNTEVVIEDTESEIESLETEGSVPESENTESEVPVVSETPVPVPETESTVSETPVPVPETESTVSETPVPTPETETEDIDDGSHYIPVPEEWNLIVVNKWNKIPEDYTIELTELPNGQKVDSRIYESLMELFEAAKAERINMFVREGYRTSEEQQRILDERIQSYLEQGYSQAQAEKMAKEWVALPGTSEHELGLAVDINTGFSSGYSQDAYKWLEENAHKYGFILRYPKGKEDITGIEYEPWHYRYVGVETATEMYMYGICLEEYLRSR